MCHTLPSQPRCNQYTHVCRVFVVYYLHGCYFTMYKPVSVSSLFSDLLHCHGNHGVGPIVEAGAPKSATSRCAWIIPSPWPLRTLPGVSRQAGPGMLEQSSLLFFRDHPGQQQSAVIETVLAAL